MPVLRQNHDGQGCPSYVRIHPTLTITASSNLISCVSQCLPRNNASAGLVPVGATIERLPTRPTILIARFRSLAFGERKRIRGLILLVAFSCVPAGASPTENNTLTVHRILCSDSVHKMWVMTRACPGGSTASALVLPNDQRQPCPAKDESGAHRSLQRVLSDQRPDHDSCRAEAFRRGTTVPGAGISRQFRNG